MTSMDDLGSLSERELEVLKLVATGATNQEIARALVISPNTVKVHLRNIFEKLGVQSRTEATMEAVRRGWVSIPGAQPGAALAPPPGMAGEGEAATLAAPLPMAQLAPPVTPRRRPIALWQRAYMIAAALAVVLAMVAPTWIRSRSQAQEISPLTDVGQPQSAAAPRPQVARWTSRDGLPEARSRLALVADGSRLYAIGGETAAGVTDQVAIYDPVSNSWSLGSSKPTPVANVAGALLHGRIYIPGGTTANGAVTDILEVYDPQADAWETRAPLLMPVAAYALAALGDRLYLFGGWDGSTYRADVQTYDPTADSWGYGTAMAAPAGFLAASPLGDVIYVVGGYDGARELSTVATYDPAGEGTAAGPWTVRASLTQPRGGLGLAASGGSRLYAVGGGWNQPLTFNEQYDAQIGAWSNIGTPVVGQWRNLGLATLGQKVYAVGGWSGTYLSVTEEYQTLLRQLIPLSGKGG